MDEQRSRAALKLILTWLTDGQLNHLGKDKVRKQELAEFIGRALAATEGTQLPEYCGEDKQVVWFHGTSAENAEVIKRDGFKEGTWFARHMEDALEFGGPCIFWVDVRFDKEPLKWQVCCSNALPVSSIRRYVELRALAQRPAERQASK